MPAALQVNDEALQKYKAIAKLPMEDRRAYFGNANDNHRSELWRAHFAEYIKNHPNLNSAQRNAVEDAAALFTPDLFRIARNRQGKNDVLDSVDKALKSHAQAAFSKEEARNIFAVLGDPAPAQNLENGVSYPAYCDCNQVHDWCWENCKGWSCWDCGSCGCGAGWIFDCNGVC